MKLQQLRYLDPRCRPRPLATQRRPRHRRCQGPRRQSHRARGVDLLEIVVFPMSRNVVLDTEDRDESNL